MPIRPHGTTPAPSTSRTPTFGCGDGCSPFGADVALSARTPGACILSWSLKATPSGQQDLTGNEFDAFGTVESTSWVSSDVRRRGIGTEMRSAILHLAFDGLGAAEAHSEGAVDNAGSNAVSERLGYERNGMAWATHQDKPVLGQRWRLDRETWHARRRDDIMMSGMADCRKALGIEPGAGT